ncbi:hypothetical protein F444_15554, partial [Phytophthora nicotianae P1976]
IAKSGESNNFRDLHKHFHYPCSPSFVEFQTPAQ